MPNFKNCPFYLLSCSLAVGYDDKMKIKNTGSGGVETTGALLIRNSWGTGWGDAGYGWLPYEYVLNDSPRTSGQY